MIIPRIHIATAVLAGVCMAVASFAGVFGSPYSGESASWAAQGTGQDYVNLFLVFPALLALSYRVAKGSVRALLVWLGILVYIAYSYVLYSFFVNFGTLFPIYVATLGLSFYAFLGAALSLRGAGFEPGADNRGKAASAYLFANGLLFAFLWISEIAQSLIGGVVPKSAADLGFVVNPVHVLDLGFILPAMIASAVMLRRGNPNGRLFAVPVITFAVVMALAIIAMIAVMDLRGLPASWIPGYLMIANAAIGTVIGILFLRNIGSPSRGTTTL